ncbi:MAG: hypothetical protein Q4C46_03115 [Bacillota bacterium]|nr:hypothetical protein [Bacillota bacterium]
MTTIIVVVVVALVFFVTICVAAFMVWKRESEIRTDSIRAIERNLEKLGASLSEETAAQEHESEPVEVQEQRARDSGNDISELDLTGIRQRNFRSMRYRNADPFSWMRNDSGIAEAQDDKNETAEQYTDIVPEEIYPDNASEELQPCSAPEEPEDEQIYEEIDLDFDRLKDMVGETRLHELEYEQEPEQIQDEAPEEKTEIEFTEVKKLPLGHDVGRSGRKYTAAELEALIKE